MNKGDVLLCKDRLYIFYCYKMDTDFIVITPLNINEEDELYSTLFINHVKYLGIHKNDIPGCKTLDDIRKLYPEFMI
jgi:hypothetical protein